MNLLTWIVIGAVVGWGAGKVFQGNGYGPLMARLWTSSWVLVAA
ncbi:MAG TPA: hypothetical protein VHM28_09745 [Anaerolineales bacterium]|nr:hypothetical protein [Anaerolineales bacterium]